MHDFTQGNLCKNNKYNPNFPNFSEVKICLKNNAYFIQKSTLLLEKMHKKKYFEYFVMNQQNNNNK